MSSFQAVFKCDPFVGPTVVYKEIPGLPGYCVGSDGSLWSRWKHGGQRKNQERELLSTWRLILGCLSFSGHVHATLTVNGETKSYPVHRLVLLAFAGPCPEGMEACHNNGNPRDNRPENLRWDTPKSNSEDKRIHGRGCIGQQNGNARLNWEKVNAIRLRYAKRETTQKELADEYRVSSTLIHLIIRGKVWLDPNYRPPGENRFVWEDADNDD